MNVLILGLGNLLLTDEAAGPRVAACLIERGILPASVEVVDGGTSGMELLETMMGRDLIVIADAITSQKHEPGDILRLDGEELNIFFRQRMSPHQIGLIDVLAALELMDASPQKLVLYGIVPENMELGLEPTPAVAAACERLVPMIECEVAEALSAATLAA